MHVLQAVVISNSKSLAQPWTSLAAPSGLVETPYILSRTEDFRCQGSWSDLNHSDKWLLSPLSFNPLKIFKIAREGESQRFKPFKQLHNRRLLWHGSRTTNFAGILSQGLRIAPPEAPVVCPRPGERGVGSACVVVSMKSFIGAQVRHACTPVSQGPV